MMVRVMVKGTQQDRADGSVRLQKKLAAMGVASRRKAEEMIAQGLIKVNGQVVTEMGYKVGERDRIEVVDKVLTGQQDALYIILNKPEGVISSVHDPRNRKTVIDLLNGQAARRVYPVGRLDFDTSGLLLLTNDGELTYRLTHPSYGVQKTYRVWLKGHLSTQALSVLESGVLLEDGLTAPAKIQTFGKQNKGKELTVVEIIIHEGKNRQVRRMFAKVGFPLVRLERIAFGPLSLDESLKPGQYRVLTEQELTLLKKEVGLL